MANLISQMGHLSIQMARMVQMTQSMAQTMTQSMAQTITQAIA